MKTPTKLSTKQPTWNSQPIPSVIRRQVVTSRDKLGESNPDVISKQIAVLETCVRSGMHAVSLGIERKGCPYREGELSKFGDCCREAWLLGFDAATEKKALGL